MSGTRKSPLNIPVAGPVSTSVKSVSNRPSSGVAAPTQSTVPSPSRSVVDAAHRESSYVMSRTWPSGSNMKFGRSSSPTLSVAGSQDAVAATPVANQKIAGSTTV